MNTSHSTTDNRLHEKHGHYPLAQTVDDFRRNIDAVQSRIAAACQRVNRDPSSVRLLPVSKTVAPERIRLAYEAGCRYLGENKAQEGISKAEALADLPELKWAMIGHLQRNKAREVARFAHEFHALDRLAVAKTLQRRLELEERTLDVFVQVNTSEEDSKYGISPNEAQTFIQELEEFSRLNVKGLMTMALFSDDVAKVRACFRQLRELRDALAPKIPAGMSVDELSMGMSGDFEIAIEEGATIVRVGQAIFGARETPDSAYWPAAKA